MLKAYLQIVAACMLLGTYGLFVKKLGYSPEVIVFFRFLFGALFLALLSLFTGHFARLRPSMHTRTLLLAGIINTGSWLMFTRSIEYTSVATGLILTYTAPCFIVLLSPLILKEPFEKKSIGALVFSFTGIILVAGFGGSGSSANSLLGNILGLSSGILYALYILMLKRDLPSEFLGIVSNFYVSATIAVASFPLAALSMPSFTLPGMILLIVLGVLVQGIGITTYMIGLGRVKAQHASILLYSEVLFGMLYAVLLLHEPVTPVFLAGVFLIIAGCVLIIFFRKEEVTSES